ncbi:hypothetical protein PJP08_29165, partial [Mycobacterium kansasii]
MLNAMDGPDSSTDDAHGPHQSTSGKIRIPVSQLHAAEFYKPICDHTVDRMDDLIRPSGRPFKIVQRDTNTLDKRQEKKGFGGP